jgi:hypothetical protein
LISRAFQFPDEFACLEIDLEYFVSETGHERSAVRMNPDDLHIFREGILGQIANDVGSGYPHLATVLIHDQERPVPAEGCQGDGSIESVKLFPCSRIPEADSVLGLGNAAENLAIGTEAQPEWFGSVSETDGTITGYCARWKWIAILVEFDWSCGNDCGTKWPTVSLLDRRRLRLTTR